MPFHPTASTACEVEIVTPDGIRILFDSREATSHLLTVQTHNDMAEACGTFQLTFAPIRLDGRTYDQLIPLRSLVKIRMGRRQAPLTEREHTVMVGLTEDHGVQEDYTRGQPQRMVTISGRSLALVLLDTQLRFFPGLADTKEGTLTLADQQFNLFIPLSLFTELGEEKDPRDVLRVCLMYFLGLSNRQALPPRAQHRETQQQAQAIQATNPDLSPQQAHQQAIKTMQRLPGVSKGGKAPTVTSIDLSTYNANREELKNLMAASPGLSKKEAALQLADALPSQHGGALPGPPKTTRAVVPDTPASPLRQQIARQPTLTGPPDTMTRTEDVVRKHNILLNLQLPIPLAKLLDMNDDAWTMFDTGIIVWTEQNTPFALTLWHYLHQFIDTTFQEFFTRVEDGVVKIHFRGKPFQNESLKPEGSRFLPQVPTLHTNTFTQEQWDAVYLSAHLRRQTMNVYNTFQVVPRLVSQGLNEPGLEEKLFPVFLDAPDHPSYLLKYGIRVLRDDTPYLTTKKHNAASPTEHKQADIIMICRSWARQASVWYGFGSEMYAGTITVLGSPDWNLGNRLVWRDERGEREAYIEGISHTYDFRTGRYWTQLRVTRVWYLAGLVDERAPKQPFTLNRELVTPRLGMEVVTPNGH